MQYGCTPVFGLQNAKNSGGRQRCRLMLLWLAVPFAFFGARKLTKNLYELRQVGSPTLLVNLLPVLSKNSIQWSSVAITYCAPAATMGSTPCMSELETTPGAGEAIPEPAAAVSAPRTRCGQSGEVPPR